MLQRLKSWFATLGVSPEQAATSEFLPDARAIELRPRPAWTRWTLYLLIAMIVVAVLWATFSEIDKLVVARGKIVTPLPNIVVQPMELSVLKSIDVRVGQVVKKGQVLATLDPTFAGADAAQLKVRERLLGAQIERLEIEMGQTPKSGNYLSTQQTQTSLLAERRANYEARSRQLEEAIARLNATLQTNRSDQRTLNERLESLKEIERMQEKLVAQNFGARIKLLEAREKRLEVEREYRLTVSRFPEIEKQILSAKAELTSFEKEWRQKALEELSTAQSNQAEVTEQLAKASRRNEMIQLTAPEEAVVLDIGKKSVGSVLKDAEPLFVLVPVNAPLEIEVEVDPADVGELRIGDAVRVKVDAYQFQKYGTLSGKLLNVSSDTFSRQSGMQGPSFYYQARVAITSRELSRRSGDVYLLPGMTLTAELVVGKRSVISYFLYPIIRTLDDSLRER